MGKQWKDTIVTFSSISQSCSIFSLFCTAFPGRFAWKGRLASPVAMPTQVSCARASLLQTCHCNLLAAGFMKHTPPLVYSSGHNQEQYVNREVWNEVGVDQRQRKTKPPKKGYQEFSSKQKNANASTQKSASASTQKSAHASTQKLAKERKRSVLRKKLQTTRFETTRFENSPMYGKIQPHLHQPFQPFSNFPFESGQRNGCN